MASSSNKHSNDLENQEYDVRGGTHNLGFEYEFKMAVLLCLRSSGPDTQNMWIAMNADDCGAFDDIIMYRKTEESEVQYLIQLKHREKDTTQIKQIDFTKGKHFNLNKYFADIRELEAKVNDESVNIETVENQGNSKKLKIHRILHHNRHNMVYIIFTNAQTTDECTCLTMSDNNDLSFINTGGNIFQFDLNELNLNCKDNLQNNTKLFFFTKQLHVNKLEHEIEEELQKLVNPLNITHTQLTKICQKLSIFITEWSKGNLGGYYTLRKNQILKVLTEFLLVPYMVKIKKSNENHKFQLDIWKEISDIYDITVVDADDVVHKFLITFIQTQVNKFLENSNSFCDLNVVKRKLLRSLSKVPFDDGYEYLWKNKALPLLLEVNGEKDLENVRNILRISQGQFHVIILNRPPTKIIAKDFFEKPLTTLDDFCEDLRQMVLSRSVVLQSGRESIKLRDCVTTNLFKFVTIRDIIHILSTEIVIGNDLKQLPDFFIPRSLECIWLQAQVLQNLKDDTFVIKCDSFSNFTKFLENNILYIDEFRICRFEEISNDPNFPFKSKIIIVQKESSLNEIYKLNIFTTAHYLILHDTNVIQWVKSVGTTEKLVRLQMKPNNFPNQITCTNFNTNALLPNLISAPPGMGKSILMDFIALTAPVDMWILKINLSQHAEYYESTEFKDLHSEPAQHLINLNNRILTKYNCQNELLVKVIFQQYLESKKVLVLFDGVDEIPFGCLNEVKKMLKGLHYSQYSICLTTRPIMKDDLERLLGTFAISINPFTRKNQVNYLTNYFTSYVENVETLTTEINNERMRNFIRQLLNLAEKNLSNRDEGFTGIPLQTNLLAQVFAEDCKDFLKSGQFISKNFDLLYLYKRFIEKKSKIFCEQYGNESYNMLYCCKKLRSLYSLKLLLHENDLKDLNINRELNEMNNIAPKLMQMMQKDGIIAVANVSNAHFVHRTFAEYLAAQWLSENIGNEYKSTANILIKKIFHPNFTIVRNFFDQILAEGCPLHLAVINQQLEKATKLIRTSSNSTTKTDKGARTCLHLIAAWGVHHPIEIQSELEIEALNQAVRKDIVDDILRTVPNDKLNGTNKDALLHYKPFDYAIASSSLCVADSICAKLKNLNQRIFTTIPNITYIERYLKIFSYGSLGSVLIMYNIVKQLKGNFKKLQNTSKTDLHWAVIKGDKKSTFQLLSSGVSVNTTDDIGMTALHYALVVTIRHQTDIIKLLLQKGANFAIADEHGKTPLYYAVHYNQIENLEVLLAYGAKTNSEGNVSNDFSTALSHTDAEGCTVLNWAAEKGHKAIVELLLEHGANVNLKDAHGLTALHWAATNDHNEIVDLLLLKEADAEAKDKVHRTPLILVAENGLTNMLKLLLSKRANLQVTDKRGWNALHWSARNGQTKTVRFLVSEGISIHSQDDEGLAALHWAALKGHAEIVKLLLLKDDTIMKAEDNEGLTALHQAATGGHKDIVSTLLSYRADIEANNNTGSTPLHMASQHGHTDTVAFLLSNGAKTETRESNFGATPLIKAVIKNYTDIATILLLNGANIEAKDNDETTSLCYAAMYGHTTTAELLLSRGADLQAKDMENMTALHWASFGGHSNTAALLLSKGAHLEATDGVGRTALHCAALNGHKDTIILLLAEKANIKAKDLEGLTAFDRAVKKGHGHILNLLKCS